MMLPKTAVVLKNMLLPLGFKVAEAVNGENGLDLAKHCSPDAVLLDLLMPGIDGFEVASRMRSMDQLQETIIVAVSASAFKEVRERSLKSGCDGFLAKPFQVDELLKLLEQHLALEWVYKETSEEQVIETRNPTITREIWQQHGC